jgi:hypothetical protein
MPTEARLVIRARLNFLYFLFSHGFSIFLHHNRLDSSAFLCAYACASAQSIGKEINRLKHQITNGDLVVKNGIVHNWDNLLLIQAPLLIHIFKC